MYSLPKNVYRERIDFSKIKTTVPIPNLIEIQKKSYERFLQMNRLPAEREDVGLQSVFKSVFPISDFSGRATLEFVRYEFGKPKYSPEECRAKGMTYSVPLKVTLRLVVWDISKAVNMPAGPLPTMITSYLLCIAQTNILY